MPRLFLILFVVEIVLAASALISLLSVEEGGIRGLPKIVWVMVPAGEPTSLRSGRALPSA